MEPAVPVPPVVDPAVPLLFLVNGSATDAATQAKLSLIRQVLASHGRTGESKACLPGELESAAREAASRALASRTAVVAVGGDGTLNTVAQAAHAVGCAMGVVAHGTFNYFARTHGLPDDPADAVRVLLQSRPRPVQVGAVNDRVFLVNASLGLYPELLEDREAYKARFGRSRVVAIGAAFVTLLRAQRSLRIRMERRGAVREVRTLTLFVGNNRLQLDQIGVTQDARHVETAGDGGMTAVMLRPIGTLAMLGLMLRGAMGTLGEADSVERFDFTRMSVSPSLLTMHARIKVAFDGEVAVMRAPLDFRVLAKPLYLLKPDQAEPASGPAEYEA
jgi:diacylglycerol kinase family enzyme